MNMHFSLLLVYLFNQVLSHDCTFLDYYPLQYVTYYTNTPPKIDGLLNEPLWQEVAWTDDFVDISGYNFPTPRFWTRAKIRWDQDWFYVGAVIQEPDIWANLTEHNSVIYHDNDFEVFINPDGSTHYYKEYEMNALNTNWNLCLNKPYMNGGYENSSRVYGDQGWDIPTLQSAVHLEGTINNGNDTDSTWSVEIAFPIDMLAVNQSVTLPPPQNSYWRLDFSRVEWHTTWDGSYYHLVPNTPEDNWVWQTMNKIDMHIPELWGYIQFSLEDVNTTKSIPDPDWALRYMAMQIYYGESAYHTAHGNYSNSIEELIDNGFVPPIMGNGTCAFPPDIVLVDGGFQLNMLSLDRSRVVHVQDDRLLYVNHFDEEMEKKKKL